MNAGIFQETPRGSEGTRPRSLDQWERQGDESSQELSRWTGEGNVSADLREQNLLGSFQSSQERLEFRALPTSSFSSDSPQKLSQPGILGGGTTWINNEFEGGNRSKQRQTVMRGQRLSLHIDPEEGQMRRQLLRMTQIPSGE